MSDTAYNTARLWTIVGLCGLRLAVTRHHLQAYLGLAERWVEQMRKEAGRITVLEIQRKVWTWELGWERGSGYDRWPPADPCCPQITRIYCYVSVVSLQYLGPIILTLHCTLLLKTLGKEAAGECREHGGAQEGQDETRKLSSSHQHPKRPQTWFVVGTNITHAASVLRLSHQHV